MVSSVGLENLNSSFFKLIILDKKLAMTNLEKTFKIKRFITYQKK